VGDGAVGTRVQPLEKVEHIYIIEDLRAGHEVDTPDGTLASEWLMNICDTGTDLVYIRPVDESVG